MIRTFNSKETQKIFNRYYSRKFPHEVQRIAFRKLRMINRARELRDLLGPPGNRLEALKGNRKSQLELMINGEFVLFGKTMMLIMLK